MEEEEEVKEKVEEEEEGGNNIVQLLCCNLNDNIDDYYFTMWHVFHEARFLLLNMLL